MDPGVIALMIPIVAIVCFSVVVLRVYSMRAAERREMGGGDTQARLDAMEQELATVRQELSEAHERLDFAERLLAKGPEARRIGEEPR
jgi:hypothetical protein